MNGNQIEAVRKSLSDIDQRVTVERSESDDTATVSITLDEDGMSRLLELLTRPAPLQTALQDDPARFVHNIAQRTQANLKAYAELMLAAWFANFDVPPTDAVMIMNDDPWHPGHFRVSVERKSQEASSDAKIPSEPDLPSNPTG